MKTRGEFHSMKTASILIVSGATLFLYACTVGPDYVPPCGEVPASFKEGRKDARSFEETRASKRLQFREAQEQILEKAKTPPEGFKFAEPRDCCERRLWWKAFNNPELNDLEMMLTVHNQSLIGAWQAYRQALASVDAARAAYWPTLTFFGSFTRQKPSRGSNFSSTSGQNGSPGVANVGPTGTTGINSPNSITGGTGGTALTNTGNKIFNNYSLSLAASWTPDFFGLVRRTVEAAEANAESTAAQFALTRLTLQATLAQTYFELRTLDSYQNLLNELVSDYEKLLQITKNRYKSGVSQQLDILQAQSQLENAEAQAIDNGIARQQYEHAIAVLVGRPPEEFCLSRAPLKTPPPKIPTEIPSALLEQRPDIAQAERLMAQANAKIGVAIAAFFPTVTLTADGGVSSNAIRTLFNRPSRFWAIGAELAELILDGGLRDANTRLAYAAFDQAVANYRQTVLSAFQNVEDNLVALRKLKVEALALNQAVRDGKKAVDIMINKYKSGTAQFSDVILQQNLLYAAKEALVNVEGRRMVAAVGLIMALGGGWDVNDLCNLMAVSDNCNPPMPRDPECD